MTAHNCLYFAAIVLAAVGWGMPALADDDVTVIPTPTSTTAPSQKTAPPDGTPVVHKSLHKKRHATTAVASTAGAPQPSPPAPVIAPVTVSNKPVTPPQQTPVTVVWTAHPPPAATIAPAQPPALPTTTKPPVIVVIGRSPSLPPANPAFARSAPLANSANPAATVTVGPAALVPTVETGLPVARYPGMGAPIKGVSTYIPMTASLPPAKSVLGATTHQPLYASVLPASVLPLTSSAAGTYSTPSRTTTPSADFVFTNFSRKTKVTYPWKSGIITTEFWIGEGGSNISSTDNVASAWDEDWRSKNRGNDSPNDRNGFATAEHASTVNPFYVALPFNDLAFPDKAREWLPSGWYRRPKDGKQVSACKDRWVWIKNAQGRSCFAQWEDVGPLRFDHAEYVFGSERPTTYTRAGLDVSPAVAQYLGIDENKRAITSWRFIDDEDVPPGAWLKYDEQAVIYTALHQLKNSSSTPDLPIQRATEPIDDPENIDSNKKKVDASKG